MKRNFVLVVFILLLGHYAFAQSNTDIKQPFIEVSGFAEKEVIPNEVYLGIRLQEYMKDKNTKVTMAMLEKDLSSVLKKAGLSKDDLKVNTLNADLQKFHKRRDEDVFAQAFYQLKVTDMSKLGPLMDALSDTDIKEVYVEKVDHSELEDHKLEVKIEAVKYAKKKADLLLNAAGEKTGEVLYIIEEPTPNYYYNKQTIAYDSYKREEDVGMLNVQEFKPIILSYTVKVRYAIAE